MPFWLKGALLIRGCLPVQVGARVFRTRGTSCWPFAFPGILSGAVAGAVICNWVGKLRGKGALRTVVGDNRWVRLTGRALRFLRRRRAIALAFNHLGSYSLRPSEGSRPNSLRQRSANTPTPKAAQSHLRRRTPEVDNILHEGPAIRNGSNRR